MIKLVRCLVEYFREIKVKNLGLTSIFVSLLIWMNYATGIEKRIKQISPWWLCLFSFFIFYFIVFALAWLFQPIPKKYGAAHLKQTIPLLFFAPLIFSFKIINWQMPSFVTSCFEFPWNRYIAVVSEFPLRLALLLTMLYFVRKFFYDDPYFFGFSLKNIKLRPYLFLLFSCFHSS